MRRPSASGWCRDYETHVLVLRITILCDLMKKHSATISVLFLFAAQLLYSTSGFATDYFVHANAGDNRNSGLQPDDAFATLSYAMSQLTPGDTLYLRTGLYTETVNLGTSKYSNGTATHPITIKSYPNEKPIIGDNVAVFRVVGRKWWVFEDLTFQNSMAMVFGVRDTSLPPEDQCIWSLSENIIVRRVHFQHSSNDGIRIACGKSIVIENNIFDNLRSRVSGRDAFGIMLTYQADNIIVSGNHFSDIGADGIQILDRDGAQYTDIEIINNEFEVIRPYKYRDTTGAVIEDPGFGNVGENAMDIKQGPGPVLIENNAIHGFRPTLPGQDATGSIGEGIVIQNQAKGITIRKNHFYDNVIHISAGRGNNTEERPERNLSISSNIFEEPADPGIYGDQIPSGVRLNDASNVTLFNNTFYNQSGYSGWVLRIVNANNVELNNNVFNNGIIAVNTDTVTNLTADHNAWSGITGNTWTGEIYPVVLGVNDVAENNLGIDPLTWSPQKSSPLIDAAAFVGITKDFYGTDVVGSAPDIGAVEYQPRNTGIPSVLITSPGDGATVSGDVQLSAVANDDVGVTEVTFAVDGNWAARDVSAPYTFDWNSSMYADGVREIQATAFDVDGNTSTDSIHVTVDSLNDIQKPSVWITGPAEGATVSGTVQVTASATDNQQISKVDFGVDGVWVGKATSAPYSFNWNTLTYANGVHKLQATAYDLAGNSSKHIIDVTINNAAADSKAPSVWITGLAKVTSRFVDGSISDNASE